MFISGSHFYKDKNTICIPLHIVESFKFVERNFLWITGFCLFVGIVFCSSYLISISVKKQTLSKFVFVEDVNTHEYHRN